MGTVVRAGTLMGSVTAKMHRKLLENALKYAKNPLVQCVRQAGQSLHHMVAHSEPRAQRARELLAKFKIDIDEAYNGVLDPLSSRKI